jgi:hypothetical protein
MVGRADRVYAHFSFDQSARQLIVNLTGFLDLSGRTLTRTLEKRLDGFGVSIKDISSTLSFPPKETRQATPGKKPEARRTLPNSPTSTWTDPLCAAARPGLFERVTKISFLSCCTEMDTGPGRAGGGSLPSTVNDLLPVATPPRWSVTVNITFT